MEDALHVHWTRPEVCIAETHGLLLGLYLAPVRSEWIPSIRAAIEASAAKNGHAMPVLAVFRLDPRFPLQIGFDSNLSELGALMKSVRTTMSACSMVLEFGGIVAMTMRSAVATLALFAGERPRLAVHASPIEGLRWLEPRVDLARFDDYLTAMRRMKDMLGVT